jgi:hypothetical protein
MNGRRQPEDNIEAWADTVLRQLPGRRAPATLASRVLGEIRARQVTPWYRQPWSTWSPSLQAATAGLAVALLGLMVWVWMSWDWSRGAESGIGFVPSLIASAATALGHLLGALWLVLLHVGGWIFIGSLAVLATAWVATLGLGTTCWRLATGHR